MVINYEEEFRKHWEWMGESGKDESDFYFDEINIPEEDRPHNYCYACESVKVADGERVWCDCSRCPVAWETTRCTNIGSPYMRWYLAGTTKTRKKYAKIISELPWVEK